MTVSLWTFSAPLFYGPSCLFFYSPAKTRSAHVTRNINILLVKTRDAHITQKKNTNMVLAKSRASYITRNNNILPTDTRAAHVAKIANIL